MLRFPRPGQHRRKEQGLKLWIDTDGGVDDALALACALASPEIELAGVSAVYGNVSPRKAARNAALVQSFFPEHRRAPVRVGADRPMQGDWRHARAVHGEDGLGGATAGHELGFEAGLVLEGKPEEAAAAMAEFARMAGPEGRMLAIGPLTHLALALHDHPRSFDGLGGIMAMGGALSVPAPRRGRSEFNFSSDAEAVHGVFALAGRLSLMPLNVCRQVVLRRARLRRIAETAPAPLTHFLARAHAHYMDAYRAREGVDGCYPHDALALAGLAAPQLFRFETLRAAPDFEGAFPGLLSLGPAGRPVRIATGVDMPGALDWIESSLRAAAALDGAPH